MITGKMKGGAAAKRAIRVWGALYVCVPGGGGGGGRGRDAGATKREDPRKTRKRLAVFSVFNYERTPAKHRMSVGKRKRVRKTPHTGERQRRRATGTA